MTDLKSQIEAAAFASNIMKRAQHLDSDEQGDVQRDCENLVLQGIKLALEIPREELEKFVKENTDVG